MINNFDPTNLPDIIKNIIPFAGDTMVYIIIAIFVGLLIYSLIKKTFNVVILSVIALPVTYLITIVLQYFIRTQRPYLDNNLPTLLDAANTLNSFPSLHTLIAMTAALVIFSEFKCLGSIIIFLAFTLGVSRFLANVHNPVDIIGSIVISIISIIIAKIILSKVTG